MKAMYPLLCIATVSACADNTHPLNGSITSALRPGMTEHKLSIIAVAIACFGMVACNDMGSSRTAPASGNVPR